MDLIVKLENTLTKLRTANAAEIDNAELAKETSELVSVVNEIREKKYSEDLEEKLCDTILAAKPIEILLRFAGWLRTNVFSLEDSESRLAEIYANLIDAMAFFERPEKVLKELIEQGLYKHNLEALASE